jgi:NAD(P)-dependent dehydrogenase (short-subunit alcohol dehydrogenase family)
MSDAKILVVTGCASGIGRHLAGALARRGHKLLATDLDEAGLARAANEDGWPEARVRRATLDVRSEAGWDAAMALAERELGEVDVLLNVAGYLKPGWVTDLEVRDIELHFDVNVRGVILGTRAAARRMKERKRGHIVNIGSLASLAPVPGLSLYSASKFAVRGFSLAAATELERHGIAVSLVMPDAVQTPMLDLQVNYEEAALTFSGHRTLTVEDIERTILDHVLVHRPLEVTVPMGRGFLARVANSAPALSRRLAPALAKRGKAKQARMKSG